METVGKVSAQQPPWSHTCSARVPVYWQASTTQDCGDGHSELDPWVLVLPVLDWSQTLARPLHCMYTIFCHMCVGLSLGASAFVCSMVELIPVLHICHGSSPLCSYRISAQPNIYACYTRQHKPRMRTSPKVHSVHRQPLHPGSILYIAPFQVLAKPMYGAWDQQQYGAIYNVRGGSRQKQANIHDICRLQRKTLATAVYTAAVGLGQQTCDICTCEQVRGFTLCALVAEKSTSAVRFAYACSTSQDGCVVTLSHLTWPAYPQTLSKSETEFACLLSKKTRKSNIACMHCLLAADTQER